MSVQDQIADLKKRQEVIQLGGGEKRIAKQHASGKLTSRERIGKLLDPNTFVEIDPFVRHRCTNFGMETKENPGEGVTTGYGYVNGRLVFVFAQDFTVTGGSLGEMHAAKIVKVQKMAMRMGAPIIGMNDSGGARIQEGVDALAGYGQIFFQNTLASGVIPQISVIMGPCAGGAVYSPAITDFIFMVDQTSKMFITGPQVIKTVTQETVDAETLGGAMTHNEKSGVAHFITSNDEECMEQIRYLLSFLPSNNQEHPPLYSTDDSPTRTDDELTTMIADDPHIPYDMKTVIEKIVDKGEYYEIQPYFAKNIITCFARMNGQTVGIIANQPTFMAGCLDINASDKSARFIRFCDSFNIPLVNLVDVPGFLPGLAQEHGGIIRHGAKLLFAYSEATVPKVTVITRKAYGGAYIGMCSKHLGADMVFAWPVAEIAVMGPAGAANIIFRGATDLEEKTAQYVKEFATPYKAAERGYVDQIIEPKETRLKIIEALNMLTTKIEQRPHKKHGSIPL
ncbi:acetyl-CoA carboxylase carboxyltransferase component [Sporomusaceae bacterium BoRhaA]|uniref:methylmalonyl-CoA decarboxylase subunit alpha n=1 Tax=Pelorhabdus rhamnosifermentans TaxID=2772457 RepID=UPI001C06232C|nr:carboxyl transferase domain-containing protein [Pelorhabdus rhamnosifermentans]MBU2701898.1 acetyl-CoA carboxylase carboxyltransferase component [Pelorhabdus rhamnosifermentans]